MKYQDQKYLRKHQYKDDSKLNVRIELHRRFSTNRRGLHRWMMDQFDFPPGYRILELGCGPGTLWVENLPRIAPDWHVRLSDLSGGMIEAARAALGSEQPNFRFEVVDIQHTPYPDGAFDAVMAHFMLYHVPDMAAALREVHRVLRPGGTFFTVTLGESNLLELYELVDRFDAGWDGGGWSAAFNLVNGAKLLASVFADVQVRRYEDSLWVTEAQPLIDYLRSSVRGDGLDGSRFAEFEEYLRHLIRSEGAIRIRKEIGMLIASKGGGG